MRSHPLSFLLLLSLLVALSSPLLAADHFYDRRPAEATSLSPNDAHMLVKGGLIVDNIRGDRAELYLTDEEADSLRNAGYTITFLYDNSREMARLLELDELDEYHDYSALTSELQNIEAVYPDITELSSLGQTVQGREIWMLEISDNVHEEELEPEFAYISTMHGDEVVGMENCLQFIHYILDAYTTDPDIQNIIDETHLYIIPSVNPDATAAGSRFNANGIDLNRNFPDRVADPYDITLGREPETVAMMGFFAVYSPALAANFHGGTIVANYPYDTNPEGQNVYTICPDDDWYIDMALTYSELNPSMYNNPEFPQGITNGSDWYSITGGMQDFTYVWRSCPHLTIELSHVKWPPANQLPSFWDDNQEAMVAFIEAMHQGIRGTVTDAYTGMPVQAHIRMDDNPIEVRPDPEMGDYYRLTLPGSYTLHVEAEGYRSITTPRIRVSESSWTTHDILMYPEIEPYLEYTFESGDEGFTHESVSDGFGDQWYLDASRHLFKCGDSGDNPYNNNLDAALVSPVIALEANTELLFWHYLDSEISSNHFLEAYDGGRVEILPDGADEWVPLTPLGDYPYTIRNTEGDGALPNGTPVYSGQINQRIARFSLAEYDGNIQLRWRFASDVSVGREGWYIDNIQLIENDAAYLVVDPGIVNFPDTEIGSTSDLTVTFENHGNSLLTIDELDLPGRFSHNWDSATQSELDPGASVEITITFEPDYVGLAFDTLSIWYNDSQLLMVDVLGIGLEASDVPGGELPTEFAIGRPYPNPFNSSIEVRVSLPTAREVRASLFNALGQRVRDFQFGTMSAGNHVIHWDSRDDSGIPVASGMYFMRIKAGDVQRVLPVSLIR